MSTPLRLLLATLFGALLGLERESSSSEHTTNGSSSGIRTYALISLLGALAGVFYTAQFSGMFVVTAVVVCALIVGYYIVGSLLSKHPGITTEISLVYAFIMGFLVMTDIIPLQLVVVLEVVVLLILSLKSRTRQLVGGISTEETESFIIYAIIALVILPLLPNRAFHLQDIPSFTMLTESYNLNLGVLAQVEILNPRKLWFVVALVTGIDVFGYMLGKLLGTKKSFTVASFVGGFISSTSTTQALAQRSKRSHAVYALVGAAILANLASFFQVFLLVAPLNGRWLVALTPTLLIMIGVAAILALFFVRKKETLETKQRATEGSDKKIFSLRAALKFAVLITAVKLVTKICLVLFGTSGFIVSSLIASFAGIDAVVINLAEMAGNTITLSMAALTFLAVNAVNLLSKAGYSFLQGNRRFAVQFLFAVLLIIVSSVVGYWVAM